MKTTNIWLDTRFHIGKVDHRIFGGFLEHMGRAVYEGVFDPNSPQADEDGCRRDVLGALQRLKMTPMRYPGGNFASGYHWLDGVGPRDKRPVIREMAWQSIEPNQFGTDEYIRLCKKMDWMPMLTVNLGTGTPEEARNWVEYCNCPAGTKYADMRVANANSQPYGVKLWCLGNEMDGLWQIGHVPADQYAIRAQQAAKMMKDTDKSIELIVCGSCGSPMTTYMEWDRQVLEYMGDLTDYLSIHQYVCNRNNDTSDYLAVTNRIDREIEGMDAVCRFVQAKLRSKKRAFVSFDEWNVWYEYKAKTTGEGKFAPHLLEEVYTLEDALVVAGFLHSFIRHADVLKIANLAQIVNVIAPVLTQKDDLLLQSIFYPFEMFAKRQNGISLRTVLEGPAYESVSYGTVHYVDTSAIIDTDKLHVFLTNRSENEAAEVCVQVADHAISTPENAELLTGPHAKSVNSFEKNDIVKTHPYKEVIIKNGHAICSIPPLSFLAMTLRLD